MPKELNLVLFALLLAAGALPAPAAAQEQDVVFAGRLTDPAVDGLVERLSASPGSRLVITSFGGEEMAGVRLGKFVQRKGVPVVVRGACLSACANSVLIASPEVEFETGAVIAFHHSATSIIRSYGRMGETAPADLAQAARIQEELYRARGVDIALLDCAAERVGQMDRYMERSEMGSTETRRLFAMRLRWWAPHQSTLERLGVTVRRGRMNEDRNRVIRTLSSPARQIAFGDPGDCR